MSDETRVQAEAALKEVEAITANLLPEPKGELVAADAADPAVQAEIEQAQGRDRPLQHPVDHPLRLGGAGRAAGDQPGDARGGAQQGRRPRGRLLARDGDVACAASPSTSSTPTASAAGGSG